MRKGLEAWITVLIEVMWPKERILEVYLNIAEFGRGVYGCEAAAHRFFHKPAARLTSSEAAILRAVLPNPIRCTRQTSAYVQSAATDPRARCARLGGRHTCRRWKDPLGAKERCRATRTGVDLLGLVPQVR